MVRSPMQVDEAFRQTLKRIQKEIMKNKGEHESFPKITRSMINTPEWKEVEKRLIQDIDKVSLRISFDRRKKNE